jgi:predicted component of type VI protein secretion system
MAAQLIVISGPDRGRTFELPAEGKLVIGRGETSATKLRDRTVSRVHCELLVEKGRYSLTNLGAASGTSVNGRRIRTQVLQPADLIRIGDTEIRFMVDSPASSRKDQPDQGPEPLSELVGTTLAHYRIIRWPSRCYGRSSRSMKRKCSDSSAP